MYMYSFFLRYEELIRDERMTYQEIQAMERKFDAWSQLAEKPDNKSKTPAAPLASARDITKDLPPQVAAFEVTREIFVNVSNIYMIFNKQKKPTTCRLIVHETIRRSFHQQLLMFC